MNTRSTSTKAFSAPTLREGPGENEPGKHLSRETAQRSSVLAKDNHFSLCPEIGADAAHFDPTDKSEDLGAYSYFVSSTVTVPRACFRIKPVSSNSPTTVLIRALFRSPVAVWRDQLHADSVDFFTYWLAVDDTRLGMEVSFERLNDQRIVCPPKTPGDDPRTSAAYVLRQCQFCWERRVCTGEHHGHHRHTSFLRPSW